MFVRTQVNPSRVSLVDRIFVLNRINEKEENKKNNVNFVLLTQLVWILFEQ
jgi:hypothetical protein